MAIQGKTLAGAEHDWYATRSGQPSAAPLSQHKRAYFKANVTDASATNNLVELERMWIQQLLGLTFKDLSSLWENMVAQYIAAAQVSKDIDQNRFVFYSGDTVV